MDENHDDGIQSFTTLGFPFHRVVLRGNTIIGYEDPDQPYRAALQGIGCFDGPFIDWVVENNVVIVDHWHGISLYGAQDCVFRNNTVIDPTPDVAPGPAWIMVNDIDGFASSGCVVANNLANTFSLEGTDVYVNNIALSDEALYAQYFVDAPGHDLHLLATSPAVDGADDLYAPPTDIEGNARPVGAHSDVGAYEYLGPLHIDAESGVGAGIYPVPTRERLFFRIGDAGRTALVEVVDQHGCIVLRERHLLSEGLDVRGLMPGIYTVRFGNVTVRFVKE
ncbi:MAG: T9SS type A sorting domain-containing protein [Flavobacteriales bacterium]|nr:MAG: T9SS type A sorting domain-containing protein [Flavobacteriales bacterium]